MPFLTMSGHKNTVRGRGKCTITFGYGLGDGSYKSYDLVSGKSYHFKWVPASLGAPNDQVRSLLELFADN